MEEISRLLPLFLKNAGHNEEFTEGICFAAWDMAVGHGNMQASAPVRLTGKTLVVAVRDQRWQKQLENLAGQILFRLNGLLGSPLVTRIHFLVDAQWVQTKRGQTVPPKSSVPRHSPDADLAAAAEKIADPKLREQFLRTALGCLNHPSVRRETK